MAIVGMRWWGAIPALSSKGGPVAAARQPTGKPGES